MAGMRDDVAILKSGKYSLMPVQTARRYRSVEVKRYRIQSRTAGSSVHQSSAPNCPCR